MKNSYFLLLFLFPFFALQGQKFPYPRIEKLYAQKNYSLCRDKITDKLKSANQKNKFWLYCLEMRCYNAEYGQKNNVSQLKHAFNSGKKMMQKYEGFLPAFALQTLAEFYPNLRKEWNNPNEKNIGILKTIYDNLFSTFHQPDAAWEAFTYLRSGDENYRSWQILSDGIQADHDLIVAGKSSDFTRGYYEYLRHLLHNGNAVEALLYFETGRKDHPAADSFCYIGVNDFNENVTLFPSYSEEEIKKTQALVDAFKSAGCAGSETTLYHWKLYLLQVNVYMKDQPKALEKARWLKTNFPSQFDTTFCISELLKYLGNTANEEDKIRLEILFQVAEKNTTESQIRYLGELVSQFGSNGNFIAANTIIFMAAEMYPTEKKKIDNLRSEFKKQMLLYLKSNAKMNRNSILAYYQLNPKNAETKKQFIGYVQNFINAKLIEKNYSECMRMIKSAFYLFPENEVLVKLQKSWVQADFEDHFKGTTKSFAAKINGYNAASCTPGKVDDNFQIEFTDMLNYVRRLAGVFDSCKLRSDLNDKAQKAAMIMDANYYLTHGPKPDAKCYTAEGAAGAGSSNLSLGENGIQALLGQLEDNGGNNSSVGHRRWILNPGTHVFGHGSSPSSMALYVFGNISYPDRIKIENIFNDTVDFVAWPAAGAFPNRLVPDRWSFSFSKADFDSCTVSVKINGKSQPVEIESRNEGYALPSVVFNIGSADVKGKDIFIEIRDVRLSKSDSYTVKVKRNFSYRVSVF